MTSAKDSILAVAKQFTSFIDKCPSPFHVVAEVEKKLLGAGYTELKESEAWKINPLGKYFLTKNKSTIVAFAVGGKYVAGNGFSMLGAHTDSPCLKLKPVSIKTKHGYIQVGVQTYGGGTWHTWFDRDLTVAGRVLVKENKKVKHRLVHIKKPIMRVPNIAIHLQRDMNDKFSPNKETHLQPIIATTIQEELNNGGKSDKGPEKTGLEANHPPVLIKLLTDDRGVKADQLIDFDLYVADTQPAAVGGAYDEFIFSPRLDNLFNVYASVEALVDDTKLAEDTNCRMIMLFDNEEVGSSSAQGAASSLQEYVLRRLCAGTSPTSFEEAIPKSMMVSADQAHAIHPNYSSFHDDNHKPGLHQGIVVKTNCNQRYATTGITSAILKEVAKFTNVPLQEFVVRNDMACGSTIGPIQSTRLALPTIDVGGPQLSMHSIREVCCTSSVTHAVDLYKAFLQHYPEVFATFEL